MFPEASLNATREPELTQTAPPTPASADLLVLRVLPTSVRCREIGGELVTYRGKAPSLVPGQRLTVLPKKRWQWRKTSIVAGELLHVDFSLRAIQHAGYGRTRHADGRLTSPGDSDARLREGILESESANWLAARCLLLDVLGEEPGNLLVHATLGEIHRQHGHHELAMAHLTAAIRLGLGALVHDAALPLDPGGETEQALLRSLVSRAALLAESGREDAAADLRRALAWDPTDSQGATPVLDQLLARAAASEAVPSDP